VTEPTETPWLRQETGVLAEFKGELEEKLLFEGSKSEHAAPVLVIQDGSIVRVMVKGDNPFNYETLRLHLGQQVSIQGTWRRGVVIVEPSDFTALPSDEEPDTDSRLAEGANEEDK
jgi:hypothetical protein